LATLWQICHRLSEVICNPLTNSSECIDNFYKYHIFARGLPLPSNPWPEGIDYPPEQLSEGRHLQEGFPNNKERGNLFAIPLKKLKVKVNTRRK
jgi:hypothetical protein